MCDILNFLNLAGKILNFTNVVDKIWNFLNLQDLENMQGATSIPA